MNEKNITARIGEDFSKELEEIKDERLARKIDKKRKSTRKLTNLIVKHRDFKKIREDTININLEVKNEK
jgi:hypothetical protein